MKIFLISSKDRVIDSAVQSFAREQGSDLQITPGVFLDPLGDYSTLANLKQCRLRLGREISISEIGIALAHLSIYKTILNENLSWAMVLEDDANLINPKLLRTQLSHIQELQPNSPTIFLLFHHNSSRINISRDGNFKKSKSIPSYALAYVLNHSAAKALIRVQEPISSIADWPLLPTEVNYWLSYQSAFIHGSETGMHKSYLVNILRTPKNRFQKWMWIMGVDLLKFRAVSRNNLRRHFYFVIQPRLAHLKSLCYFKY
jgi:GR25 family glycosyltransferase involved in LPS biosynthesis